MVYVVRFSSYQCLSHVAHHPRPNTRPRHLSVLAFPSRPPPHNTHIHTQSTPGGRHGGCNTRSRHHRHGACSCRHGHAREGAHRYIIVPPHVCLRRRLASVSHSHEEISAVENGETLSPCRPHRSDRVDVGANGLLAPTPTIVHSNFRVHRRPHGFARMQARTHGQRDHIVGSRARTRSLAPLARANIFAGR